MSRIVYFDCASGASGDMVLGAVVDLGLPIERLREEVAKLPFGGYRLEARRVSRSGLAATKVDVVVEDARPSPPAPAPHPRAPRRALARRPTSRSGAAALFRRLAEAEAAVHGTDAREGPLPRGRRHRLDRRHRGRGLRPRLARRRALRRLAAQRRHGDGDDVPRDLPGAASRHRAARGRRARLRGGEGELLTPTGALLVTAHATAYGSLPPMRIEATGHGAGGRETKGRPNVLRLIVGEEAAAPAGDRVLVLETEVDDAVAPAARAAPRAPSRPRARSTPTSRPSR